MKNYLNNTLISGEKYHGIKAPLNYGEVKNSAKVDNKTLIYKYVKKIIPNSKVNEMPFSDGGEGAIDFLKNNKKGTYVSVKIQGCTAATLIGKVI